MVPVNSDLPGRLRLPAFSTSFLSSKSFCTMNCARSPTTLLLGVTCRKHMCSVHLYTPDQMRHTDAFLDESSVASSYLNIDFTGI